MVFIFDRPVCIPRSIKYINYCGTDREHRQKYIPTSIPFYWHLLGKIDENTQVCIQSPNMTGERKTRAFQKGMG